MNRLGTNLVQALSYPGIMALGFALFAGLSAAGLPVMISSYGAVAVATFLIAVHEAVLPYRTDWRPDRSDVTNDAAFLILMQILLPAGLSLLVVLALAGAVRASGWAFADIWPHHWPLALQAALMLLLSDFLRYWMHRAFHTLTPMWRFHAVHHSPHKLYWLNVGRFHPGDKALQYCVDSAPFVLLGVAEPVLALYFVFYAINGFFQHSNCAVRLGPLNYLISGPELHRWHHAKEPSESDTNFGNNLILWDLAFGTRFLPRDREVGQLGLLNRDYPMGLRAQMTAPFASGLDKA